MYNSLYALMLYCEESKGTECSGAEVVRRERLQEPRYNRELRAIMELTSSVSGVWDQQCSKHSHVE